MHHCGGKLHGSEAPAQTLKAGLHGSLELPGLSNKLDMQLPGVKLFAVELAALQGSAQQQLDMLKQQPAEQLDKVGVVVQEGASRSLPPPAPVTARWIQGVGFRVGGRVGAVICRKAPEGRCHLQHQ